MGNVQNSSYCEPHDIDPEERQAVLGGAANCTLAGIAEKLKRNEIKRVVVVAGAGISVSAGIPDFRTPGTGLYDNLQSYGLPDDEPTAIFDIEFFAENPRPFTQLAGEMYPRPLADGSLKYKPTATHFFLRLLHQKGILRRVYTQNIDCLERACGVPTTALVECHGSFSGGHCISCKRAVDPEWLREEFFAGKIPQCAHSTTDRSERESAEAESESSSTMCGGYCKPDITFFGENLPERFHSLHEADVRVADLLIVMGTSLQVQPVSNLPGMVDVLCPRLLINREPAGLYGRSGQPAFMADTGFRFMKGDNYRDVFNAGDCDESVMQLCEAVGWTDELLTLQRGFTAASATEYAAQADAAYSAAEEKAADDRLSLNRTRALKSGPIGTVPLDISQSQMAQLAQQFSPDEMEALQGMLMGEGGTMRGDGGDLVDTDEEEEEEEEEGSGNTEDCFEDEEPLDASAAMDQSLDQDHLLTMYINNKNKDINNNSNDMNQRLRTSSADMVSDMLNNVSIEKEEINET